MGLYTPGNSAAISAGAVRISIMLTPYFMCGLMEVGSGVMRGLGRSTTSMITSLIGSVAFRIFWILVVFNQFPTLEVLYLSYPIAWVLTACAHYTLAFIALRKEERAALADGKETGQ
jgi:Na+-driven multidrug efflux pump